MVLSETGYLMINVQFTHQINKLAMYNEVKLMLRDHVT